MKKLEITCDTCGADITTTGPMPAHRLELRAVDLPQTGGFTYAVMNYPPIDRDYHFCGIKCLAQFVIKKTGGIIRSNPLPRRDLRGNFGRHHMNDNQIEKEIQDKGLTAPRVTPADIEVNIAGEHYFTAFDGVYGVSQKTGDVLPTSTLAQQSIGLLTFCVLVLQNGFTVTGESACASPENFDAELGRKIARQNAVNKIWPLMGYALKQKLYESKLVA